jgi:hypothetical protein
MEVDGPVNNVSFSRVWAHIATLQFYLMDQPQSCGPVSSTSPPLLSPAALTPSTAAVSALVLSLSLPRPPHTAKPHLRARRPAASPPPLILGTLRGTRACRWRNWHGDPRARDLHGGPVDPRHGAGHGPPRIDHPGRPPHRGVA